MPYKITILSFIYFNNINIQVIQNYFINYIEKKALKNQNFKDKLQSIIYKLVTHLVYLNNKYSNYCQSCYISAKNIIYQAIIVKQFNFRIE